MTARQDALRSTARRSLLLLGWRRLRAFGAAALCSALLPAGSLAAAVQTGRRAATPLLSPENAAAGLWDVVVVGSGLAGLSAAVSARQSGARRVLIVEAGPLVGGPSLYSSGSIAAVMPPIKDRTGRVFRDSPQAFLRDAQEVGGGKGDDEILLRIAQGSHAAIERLERCGIVFGRPFISNSGLSPRSYAMPGNSAGRSYVLAVYRSARQSGVETLINARIAELAPGSSARTWTLKAVLADGRAVAIAARAVVLATGGFTANVKRRQTINPLLDADVHTSANPYNTVWDGAAGDGLTLAAALGASIRTGFGLQLLPFWGGRLLDYPGGDIYLDFRGRRFADESMRWNALSEEILRLPERQCWVVTDAQSYKGATLGLKLINGIVHKAQSVAELARGMQVDLEILSQTIDDYNNAARRGFDPKTGKRIFTQTISEPPYYYGKERIYVHTTLDGIRTDAGARVLSESRQPIPGLFACGETVGGIFGTDRLGGAALANCLVMGAVAGESAVKHLS